MKFWLIRPYQQGVSTIGPKPRGTTQRRLDGFDRFHPSVVRSVARRGAARRRRVTHTQRHPHKKPFINAFKTCGMVFRQSIMSICNCESTFFLWTKGISPPWQQKQTSDQSSDCYIARLVSSDNSHSHLHVIFFHYCCRYETGEKYVRHDDHLDHHLHRKAGVRMLTLYM